MKNTDANKKFTIEVQRGTKSLEAISQLSSFVKELPLNENQNMELIELAKKMLMAAEEGSYIQGFSDCCKAIREGSLDVLYTSLNSDNAVDSL